LDANEGFVIELATNASLPLGDYRPDGRLTA
jgi:hypothetical protein